MSEERMGKRKQTLEVRVELPGPSKRRNINTPAVDETKVEMEVGPAVQENVAKTMELELRGVALPEVLFVGKSEVPFVGKSEVHPLLIDHVIEKVFKYLIRPESKTKSFKVEDTFFTKDVRSCNGKALGIVRLVCTEWNAAATKLLRQEGVSILFTATNTNNKPMLVRDLKTARFLMTMENSKMIPVQVYSFGVSFFRKANKGLLADFFRICGPSAVELTFQFDDFSIIPLGRMEFPTLNLEKLRKLVIINGALDLDAIANMDMPWFVANLLPASPALHEFSFVVPDDGAFSSLEDNVFVLNEIISEQLPTTVKMLSLDVPLKQGQLQTLLDRHFTLEEVKLNLRYVVGTEVLQNFFEQQASILKALVCFSVSSTPVPPLDFPRLERLTSLEIFGLKVNPVSYQDSFPNLETLNLEQCKKEERMLQMLSPEATSNSIRTFHFSRVVPPTPMMAKMSPCFPNLKAVHLHILKHTLDISEVFLQAFLHFRGIEEFCIYYDPWLHANVEPIFGGISEKDYKRILQNGNFAAIKIEEMRNMPSILNLTKLRKLVLTSLSGASTFTDFAVYFIFMKMECLKELQLLKGRCRMSPKYFNLLRRKVTLKCTR